MKKIERMFKTLDPNDSVRSRKRLVVLLSILTFSNIACFTIVTSFTKSNFLNAIANSTYFINIYNQKPYFLLYGLTGISFVIYSCIYYIYGSKVSFERRIKHETLAMLAVSLVLYVIPQIVPDLHKQFLPAMGYYVITDIFDELIIVQTWSLINYCINIRESKRYQFVFLLSGSIGALTSGYLIIAQVSGDNQLTFLLMAAAFSACSYAIIAYIFHGYRYRIDLSVTATKLSLKTLLSSQKTYKIIRSIVQIVIIIGIFNLFFKVLFDVQINAHFSAFSPSTVSAPAEEGNLAARSSKASHIAADPKTTFIGRYKASLSVIQVLLQLLFVTYFARLWLNGKVLYAYPFLLIPNLLFILGVYFFQPAGHQALILWGVISACAINDLLKRVIFDSSYQLLMFSIPENLSNAIRLYSKLFFKPVFIIGICAIFLMIPELKNPMKIYTIFIIISLAAMLPIISRIPRRYTVSLRKGIQRRNRIESVRGSLINYKTNLIIDEYKIIREYHNDKFNYLYLLNLIRNSYTSDLDDVLREMLKHENRDVRLKTVSVIHHVKATHLVADLEKLCQTEEDAYTKETCLQAIAVYGPAKGRDIALYIDAEDTLDLLKYNLTIVHRWGSDALKETAESKVLRLLNSEDDDDVLAGIWLVGELNLAAFKVELQRHFSKHSDPAFAKILEALSKMDDLDLFVTYLEEVGFDNIRNYASLNQYLARFEGRAFDVIFDMLIFMTRSKSYIDLEKCLRTLRFLPSQDTVDFLVDTLFRFPNPHVKREVLLCIKRIRKVDQDLNFDEFVGRLPDEIEKCRDLFTDYQIVALTRPNSLLLLELARKIEAQIWMIFQILDLLNPELMVMDTFFRIKWFSHKNDNVDHTRAKSIEYLEVIIKQENIGILQLLDAIRFDDGLFCGAVMPTDSLRDVEDVYQEIFQGQDYWLKLAAAWDLPLSIRGQFKKFFSEIETMIPLLERAHLIKDSPMLKGLSMMELTMFAEFMEIVEFQKQTYVFEIGDPADTLYQLLEGKAELLDEDQKRVDLLEAPISIGYGFIIQKSVRRYAMKCIEDCRMIKISRDGFNEILELNPRIYKNIYEILLMMVDKDVYRL